MSLCPFCGAPLPENSRFCPRCGGKLEELTPPAAPEPPVPVPEPASAFEGPAPLQNETAPAPLGEADEAARDLAFRELRMHLHQESKAWRFYAIGVLVVMMSIAGLFLFLGLSLGSVAFDRDAEGILGSTLVSGFFVTYSGFITLLLLPVVIVGFVMGSKVLRYYNESAANCENAIKHAGSVGVIVLAAIFSTPALIFVIINFAKTKKRRAALEAVLARQKAAGGASFHG